MIEEELSMGDYKTMKASTKVELDSLNIKKLTTPYNDSKRIKFYAYCLDNNKSLGNAYSECTEREKQLVLTSAYKEKLVFPKKKSNP